MTEDQTSYRRQMETLGAPTANAPRVAGSLRVLRSAFRLSRSLARNNPAFREGLEIYNLRFLSRFP
jgi:hypothetical protein